MIEVKMERGIETAIISVLRQLPRNTRIMIAVRHAAISASRKTPEMAPCTNTDWSPKSRICRSGGSVFLTVGNIFLIEEMMSNVEAVPIF